MRSSLNAALTLLAALALGLAVTGCGRTGSEHQLESRVEPDGVLLISIDTLRADHVGPSAAMSAVSPGQSLTPHIDALAAGGTRFTQAQSPMPLTRPAHATMMTGMLPRSHGVVDNRFPLPEDAPTLAEQLRDHGFRTGAFTSATLLNERSGIARGFERVENPQFPAQEQACETTVLASLSWFDTLAPDDPFFLWTHFFEPHIPFKGEDGQEIGWDEIRSAADAHDGDVPAALLDDVRSSYRQEVRRADACVGTLIKRLGMRRDLDSILVIVTADHGECFEQGIYFDHADCLWEGAIAVPLIVRFPGRFARGATSSDPVGLIDIPTTVLDLVLADERILPKGDGHSLADVETGVDRKLLIQYPIFHERAVRSRRARGERIRSVAGEVVTPPVLSVERVALVDRGWKYLRDGDERALYARSPRIDEQRNLVHERPDVVAAFDAELSARLRSLPLTMLESGKIDEKLLEALRVLGYLEKP